MHASPPVEQFEYRPSTQHYVEYAARKRIFWQSFLALIGIAVVVSIVIFALSGIKNWADFQHFLLTQTGNANNATSQHYVAGQPPHETLGSGWRMPEFFWFQLLYFLAFGAIAWLLLAAPKRCSLTLTDDALIQSYRLPFGLNKLLPVDWRIALRDITAVEFIQAAGTGPNQMPNSVMLSISQRGGPVRKLHPAMWFVPGSPARVPIQAVDKPSFFTQLSRGSLSQKNLALTVAALSDLPIVQALRARGVVIAEPDLLFRFESQNQMDNRTVQFGIAVGLGLTVATILLMIARKHQHLQFDFPHWLDLGIGALALLAFWCLGRKSMQDAPLSHRILATLSFAAGLMISAQQIVLMLNGLGLTTEQPQIFIVHDGNLKPVQGQSAIGEFTLPGSENGIAWLKEGTTLTLSVKKGRLGLWEYDDTALRELAWR